jgi:hypothetical protein
MIALPDRWAGVVLEVSGNAASNWTILGYRQLREVVSGFFVTVDVDAGSVRLASAGSSPGSSFMVSSNINILFYSALVNGGEHYYIGVQSGKLSGMLVSSMPAVASAFESGTSFI